MILEFCDIYQSKNDPKQILQWFRLMNVNLINFMKVVHKEYRINENQLEDFQIDL